MLHALREQKDGGAWLAAKLKGFWALCSAAPEGVALRRELAHGLTP